MKPIIVKLMIRPVVKGKRKWQEAKPKTQYPLDTIFFLRWLPTGATNYRFQRVPGVVNFRMADVYRAGFEPDATPVVEKKSSEPRTLEEFRKAFLHDKNTTRKKDGSPLDWETLRAYDQVTRGFIDITRRLRPTEVTKQHIRDWICAQRQRVEHRTVCNLYTYIACFLRFCGVDHKTLLPRHERPTPVDETPEAFEPEEMVKFFFNIVDERSSLGYEFLLKTGAREKEMTTLDWTCLRLGPKPTVTFLNREDRRIKNGKTRIVPLEKELAAKLTEWRKKNPTTVLVFGTKNGKVDGKFWERCKAIATRSGMNPDKFWLHKFRDSFATWSLRRGVDIRTVQEWLGHASILETQRYLAPAQGDRAQELMNSVFRSNQADAAGA